MEWKLLFYAKVKIEFRFQFTHTHNVHWMVGADENAIHLKQRWPFDLSFHFDSSNNIEKVPKRKHHLLLKQSIYVLRCVCVCTHNLKSLLLLLLLIFLLFTITKTRPCQVHEHSQKKKKIVSKCNRNEKKKKKPKLFHHFHTFNVMPKQTHQL